MPKRARLSEAVWSGHRKRRILILQRFVVLYPKLPLPLFTSTSWPLGTPGVNDFFYTTHEPLWFANTSANEIIWWFMRVILDIFTRYHIHKFSIKRTSVSPNSPLRRIRLLIFRLMQREKATWSMSIVYIFLNPWFQNSTQSEIKCLPHCLNPRHSIFYMN